ncbi:MAG TPA: alpha/beta fold hydrolase [Terriglobales bacterium]|nr:alpha/beta fold hydrolase [Terriglobales bacterium]
MAQLSTPWWLRNGHANTVYSFLRGRGIALPPAHEDWVEVEPKVELLIRSHWQRQAAPALLLVHGLEGSSEAGYMLTTATAALGRGWHVARMNVRGCGDSEPRCATLYNSGKSGDVARAVEWLASRPLVSAVAVGGFSMGGNLVLKYAGERAEDALPPLLAVAAVSPCLDLAASADALHRKVNYFYERRFLENLKGRLRRHDAREPGRYPVGRLGTLRSVRAFDDVITAPFTGYRNADDYYFRASAARVLDRIRVPTLILHAEDDPFIVVTQESRNTMEGNPNIRFIATRHGGHCAFINTRRSAEGVYWAETRVAEFCDEVWRRGRKS